MKLLPLIILSLLVCSLNLNGQNAGTATNMSNSMEGTSLGANETLNASGISLGNRVKMRGFVDFRYDYTDLDELGDDDARFRTATDIDFLFDFSPVTGEVHMRASPDELGLEQAFIRYNFNQDFSVSAGRQLTVLGFEKDESPNMYQTSYAYLTDVSKDVDGGTGAATATSNIAYIAANYAATHPYLLANPMKEFGSGSAESFQLPSFRRNYVDGLRLNFNNGQFGFVAGLHNGYFTDSDHLNDGNIGLDIAASVMIIPGLEFRLGFGYENNDAYNNSIEQYNTWASGLKSALITDAQHADADKIRIFPESDEISQFNMQLAYQTGGLTLALEWDVWDVYVIDLWNMMFLANYQFNDLFALTFRYSHEDFEADVPGGGEGDSDRFTFGPTFSVSDYLTIGIEYSHAELDSTNTGDTSVDELYAETIFSF